jgi:uncharacterized RDD family membrane protein YckC
MIENGEVTAPSVRRRLACVVYEAFLLSAVILALTFPYVVLTQHLAPEFARAGLQFYLLLVSAGYFTIFWRKGQTLAMKTWNLKLVDANGDRASWGILLRRFLFSCLNLACLGLGWWGALFRNDRQFLHDHFAGTRIIVAPPPRRPPTVDQATTAPSLHSIQSRP